MRNVNSCTTRKSQRVGLHFHHITPRTIHFLKFVQDTTTRLQVTQGCYARNTARKRESSTVRNGKYRAADLPPPIEPPITKGQDCF